MAAPLTLPLPIHVPASPRTRVEEQPSVRPPPPSPLQPLPCGATAESVGAWTALATPVKAGSPAPGIQPPRLSPRALAKPRTPPPHLPISSTSTAAAGSAVSAPVDDHRTALLPLCESASHTFFYPSAKPSHRAWSLLHSQDIDTLEEAGGAPGATRESSAQAVDASLEVMCARYRELLEYLCMQQRRDVFLSTAAALRRAYGLASARGPTTTMTPAAATDAGAEASTNRDGDAEAQTLGPDESRAANEEQPHSRRSLPSSKAAMAQRRRQKLLTRLYALPTPAPTPTPEECASVVQQNTLPAPSEGEEAGETALETPHPLMRESALPPAADVHRTQTTAAHSVTPSHGDVAGLRSDVGLGSFLESYISFMDSAPPYFMEDYATQADAAVRRDAHRIAAFLSRTYIVPVLEQIRRVYAEMVEGAGRGGGPAELPASRTPMTNGARSTTPKWATARLPTVSRNSTIGPTSTTMSSSVCTAGSPHPWPRSEASDELSHASGGSGESGNGKGISVTLAPASIAAVGLPRRPSTHHLRRSTPRHLPPLSVGGGDPGEGAAAQPDVGPCTRCSELAVSWKGSGPLVDPADVTLHLELVEEALSPSVAREKGERQPPGATSEVAVEASATAQAPTSILASRVVQTSVTPTTRYPSASILSTPSSHSRSVTGLPGVGQGPRPARSSAHGGAGAPRGESDEERAAVEQCEHSTSKSTISCGGRRSEGGPPPPPVRITGSPVVPRLPPVCRTTAPLRVNELLTSEAAASLPPLGTATSTTTTTPTATTVHTPATTPLAAATGAETAATMTRTLASLLPCTQEGRSGPPTPHRPSQRSPPSPEHMDNLTDGATALARSFRSAVRALLAEVVARTVANQAWHARLHEVYTLYLEAEVEPRHGHRTRQLMRLRVAGALEERLTLGEPYTVVYAAPPPAPDTVATEGAIDERAADSTGPGEGGRVGVVDVGQRSQRELNSIIDEAVAHWMGAGGRSADRARRMADARRLRCPDAGTGQETLSADGEAIAGSSESSAGVLVELLEGVHREAEPPAEGEQASCMDGRTGHLAPASGEQGNNSTTTRATVSTVMEASADLPGKRRVPGSNRFHARVVEARARLIDSLHNHVNALFLHVLCETTIALIEALETQRRSQPPHLPQPGGVHPSLVAGLSAGHVSSESSGSGPLTVPDTIEDGDAVERVRGSDGDHAGGEPLSDSGQPGEKNVVGPQLGRRAGGGAAALRAYRPANGSAPSSPIYSSRRDRSRGTKRGTSGASGGSSVREAIGDAFLPSRQCSIM